jgi:ABC-2 type transport system ATP-binding protein
VGEYSKGMQRRIGLAQALINDPQLLILDEPTTGMDPIGTRQIKDLILDLRSRGKTILLCSHLLADVEDVTDRVAIMFGGCVRKTGSMSDLLTRRDVTTLSMPALDEQEINAMEQILERRGKQIDRVEHPRQKLEELFLDIVHEAQREGLATSGATSGGRMAAFLMGEQRGAHLPEDMDAHQLLDALTADRAQAPEAELPPTSPPEPVDAVLEELVSQAPGPSSDEPTDARSGEESPADRKPADRKVDEDLLRGLTGDGSK